MILGSGVNTDGRPPNLTQPSAEVQEALLREAYTASGVRPDEVAYVEMHGTDTPVGEDPAECRAVGRAPGAGQPPSSPLPVGSVKSQLGHLEPASGMAGLLKALLVLRHRRVPASLHALPLNPAVDFAGLRLAPVVEPAPLRVPSGGRAVIGVSSFGFGGTNAHIALADPPPRAPAPFPVPDGAARLPVLVSARTPAEAARRMAARLRRCPAEEFYDLAHTSFLRRGRHEHRAVVLARGPQEAAERFDALARGEQDVDGALAEGTDGAPVALAFSGNGAHGGRVRLAPGRRGADEAGRAVSDRRAQPLHRAGAERAGDAGPAAPVLGRVDQEERLRLQRAAAQSEARVAEDRRTRVVPGDEEDAFPR